MNLYELHEKMTGHLFPAYSNTDERFLALALAGEAGELAELVEAAGHDEYDVESMRDEVADSRVYLELLAKCFGIEGPRLDIGEYYDVNSVHWSLALCARTGALANLIKKRWRDGASNDDECRKKIVEIRGCLEYIALCLGIEGEKLDARVVQKLERVVEKHQARLFQGTTLVNDADTIYSANGGAQ